MENGKNWRVRVHCAPSLSVFRHVSCFVV